MAQPDRETVYAALLTLLSTALGTTFLTYTRRFTAVTNFAEASAPALLQVQAAEDATTKKGLPTVHTYNVTLLLYAFFGGASDTVPATGLNALVTAVEAAVGPNLATGFQQLGIPVSSVVVSGKIEYGDQAAASGMWSVALVPIQIVATY